jgi:hypothetical protein
MRVAAPARRSSRSGDTKQHAWLSGLGSGFRPPGPSDRWSGAGQVAGSPDTV